MATSTAVLSPSFLPFRSCEDELSKAFASFVDGDVATAPMAARRLRDLLTDIRQRCSSEDEWRRIVDEQVRQQPVYPMALQDPFVRRANAKPRGYAGDAVMLDYIYQHPSRQADLDEVPPMTRAAMQFTTNANAPRAVRNRAALLAAEIDALARRKARPAVFSMACGHLREALMSRAVQAGELGRFLAIDQDPESLAVVSGDVGRFGVEVREGSVKTVIARGATLGKFDFVYAAGLYDYLNEKWGQRLLEELFNLLEPGGKVWVANFKPGIDDRAYMEALMDWWLIYRDEAEMMSLADSLPAELVARKRVFTEHEDNIVFLEVVRRG